MDDTEEMVRDYLTLITPLVPTGRVAVVITGTPKRSAHIQLHKHVVHQAARYKTHRLDGVSRLNLHFGTGSRYSDGSNVYLTVDVDEVTKKKRVYRMISLLVVLLLLWRIAG